MKNSDYVLRLVVSHSAILKRTRLTPILHSLFFILHFFRTVHANKKVRENAKIV